MESRLWNPGCGILAMKSWLWNPGRVFLAVASWLESVEAIWEYLAHIWEASGRHLGGIWEASGSQEQPGEARGGQRQVWTKKYQKSLSFSVKTRATPNSAAEWRR